MPEENELQDWRDEVTRALLDAPPGTQEFVKGLAGRWRTRLAEIQRAVNEMVYRLSWEFDFVLDVDHKPPVQITPVDVNVFNPPEDLIPPYIDPGDRDEYVAESALARITDPADVDLGRLWLARGDRFQKTDRWFWNGDPWPDAFDLRYAGKDPRGLDAGMSPTAFEHGAVDASLRPPSSWERKYELLFGKKRVGFVYIPSIESPSQVWFVKRTHLNRDGLLRLRFGDHWLFRSVGRGDDPDDDMVAREFAQTT